jgi:GMP synthase-like glutamine amidotransferase
MLRVHHLQHVPFEGLGSMEAYFLQRGHRLSTTFFYRGEQTPVLESFDWLVVMGGPMGVADTVDYPWLKQEQQFIRTAIDAGKIVLGFCLGAQLIAAALGARVMANRHREIGWFAITTPMHNKDKLLDEALAGAPLAFHWHGDTFELPPGSQRLASSEACHNQAFSLDQRVFGFQFHMETTAHSARALLEHCGSELDNSRYVQTADEILANPDRFDTINLTMAAVLSAIEQHHSE